VLGPERRGQGGSSLPVSEIIFEKSRARIHGGRARIGPSRTPFCHETSDYCDSTRPSRSAPGVGVRPTRRSANGPGAIVGWDQACPAAGTIAPAAGTTCPAKGTIAPAAGTTCPGRGNHRPDVHPGQRHRQPDVTLGTATAPHDGRSKDTARSAPLRALGSTISEALTLEAENTRFVTFIPFLEGPRGSLAKDTI